MKHTPGPWTYYWRTNDDGETDCGVKNYEGVSVCRAPRFQSKEQWEYDARLITKAPEMYELLTELEAYFADRADAEYHTDSPGAVGNEEMSLLVQIQEVLK